MDNPSEARAWIEIDRAALAHNIALLKSQTQAAGSAKVMAVVKANAYGHGLESIIQICYLEGVRHFGVATLDEGQFVRGHLPHDTHIYILSPVLPEHAEPIIRARLTSLVSTPELAEALSLAACRLGINAEAHLDIDTGMGRSGCLIADGLALLTQCTRLPGLRMTGIATHFACAETDIPDVQSQHDLFRAFLKTVPREHLSLLIHTSNSGATFTLGPSAFHSLVRPGLLLYGIEPAPGLFDAYGHFEPVLSLRARVTLCRFLPAGTTISYGKTFTVPDGGGRFATIAIGYGDGYPRRLSNGGYALIRGRRAPIRGRVCMDQLVVEVTHIPDARTGDTATLVGTDGEETLTASELAAEIDATPHEISTCLTARLPRILVNPPLQ